MRNLPRYIIDGCSFPLLPLPPTRIPQSASLSPPQDLEGIVDTFSDDEGDKAAQDSFITTEAAAGDRQALKDMVRRVREGFGDERGGGRGRGGNARGNLRLDELTRADKSTRGEARRLGLLNRLVGGREQGAEEVSGVVFELFLAARA